MKKLMIAAAIVCAAALSQAATVAWNSNTFTKEGLPAALNPYNVATVYAYEITKTQFDTYGDDMKAAYADKANWGSEVGSKKINGTGKANITSGAATSWAAGSEHWVVFVSEMTDTNGNTYYYANTANANVGAGDNTTAIANYGTTLHGGTEGAATQWYAAVPEPTSGLLLLLGVAGLALRRRRA